MPNPALPESTKRFRIFPRETWKRKQWSPTMERSDSLAPIEPVTVAPEIMDIKQAAIYLRVGEGVVHEFVAADKLPHFWRGNGLFFRRAQLDVWVARAERLYLRQETITLERAAAYLEMAPAMLVQLAEKGSIWAVRDGNKWRFALPKLDAWREEQERKVSPFTRRKELSYEKRKANRLAKISVERLGLACLIHES
jgi:excisionase family DNA binding protein